jgi:hypothetical protein
MNPLPPAIRYFNAVEVSEKRDNNNHAGRTPFGAGVPLAVLFFGLLINALWWAALKFWLPQ